MIYGHYPVADSVVRSVERNRQRYLKILFGKFLYFIDKSAGRNGNMPLSYVHSRRVVDVFEKTHKIIKIVERFADAHDNYIRNFVVFIDERDLHEHFARGKVSYFAF